MIDLEPAAIADDPKSVDDGWPLVEVPETVNITELGNLGLSGTNEEALIKFMKTCNDGYLPEVICLTAGGK